MEPGSFTAPISATAWPAQAASTVNRLISPATAQRLTSNTAADRWPRVSPNGSQIAFFSNRDGNHELFAINKDGSNLVQLTRNTVDDGYAVWGP